MANNYWGPPDDEPLPDWMNPETYRNGNQVKPKGKSLTEAIMTAAQKPPVDLSYLNREPKAGNNDE
jgi:hypothetical protein